MLGITNRGVLYKFAEVIYKLYRLYVRPYLENCIVLNTNKCEKCRYVKGGTKKYFIKLIIQCC